MERRFELPDYVTETMVRLRAKGFRVYVVGGAVRDFLLGKTPNDFDLTTDADVAQIKETLAGNQFIIPGGVKHGTVAMHFGKNVLEVSTFRHEKEERVCIENDLIHRDLTINAIAFDGESFIDPHHGLDDLRHQLLRMPINPDERLKEDPLRALRVLRFHAQLGFAIDESVKPAINRFATKLTSVAKERILVELRHILLAEDIDSLMSDYQAVFVSLFPDLGPTVGFDQHNRWHAYELYDHISHVVSRVKPDFVTRISALLHDNGKVNTVSVETFDDGSYCYHFPKHPLVSADMAEPVIKTYRLNNKEIVEVRFLIREHDRHIAPTAKSVAKLLAKIESGRVGDPITVLSKLLDLQTADHSDHTTLVPIPSEEILSIAQDILNGQCATTLKDLSIKGTDLGNLGYHGALIGKGLQLALEAVIDEIQPNEKKALLAYIKAKMPLE